MHIYISAPSNDVFRIAGQVNELGHSVSWGNVASIEDCNLVLSVPYKSIEASIEMIVALVTGKKVFGLDQFDSLF
jgi:hypothetical protein